MTLWSRALAVLLVLPMLALAAPERIVALTPHSVEMLYAIGAGERIVATVSYADYPEAAKAIPRVGRHDHLDLEQIMLLEPDLIVLGVNDTAAQLYQQLQLLGVPIVDSGVDAIDEVPDRLETLGELTGNASQAKQVAAEFRHQLKALRSRYRHQSPVPVFLQVFPEPLITTANGWLSQIISDCGGDNVFDGAENGMTSEYPQISVEQVLVRQPQLIIRPHHGGMDLDAMDWSRWPEIPAVAGNHILDMDGDTLNRTGPRVLIGMAQVCQAIDDVRGQL